MSEQSPRLPFIVDSIGGGARLRGRQCACRPIDSHIGAATGVDPSGNVVGFHRDVHGGPSVDFLWSFATGAHFLPGLPNGGASAAVAISGVNREILGWAIDALR
ncbi:MAG TPA: hypothetical protein VFA43_05050 [Gemmatimonadaceae bacterium]|nr:hypothetical protein [Gemmatimonadaceae bacterium]